MTSFLRTPEERFANLPDFGYKPHYVKFSGFRMAYIDESTKDYNSLTSHTFLCLHGVPTYSYLYRKMIPAFLNSSSYHNKGVRVICPDFIGWGRSDKPTGENFHSMKFARDSIIHLIKTLKLNNLTLVCQDWGGLIGLTIPMEDSITKLFKRAIIFNTALSDGSFPGDGFMSWRKFVSTHPDMNLFGLFQRGSPHLTKEELNGYLAPFPSVEYKKSIQQWPLMVPINPNYVGMDLHRKAIFFWKFNAIQNRKSNNGIKIFLAHGLQDPVFPKKVAYNNYQLYFGKKLSNECGSRKTGLLWIPSAGHFVQHDAGEYLATKALKYFGDIPYDYCEYEHICRKNSLFLNKLRKRYKNDKRYPVLITFSNGENGNSLSYDVVSQLNNIFLTLENDKYTGGYVLTSIPCKNLFSGGYDIPTFLKKDRDLTRKYFSAISTSQITMDSISKPIVCALNGSTVAGGVVLALYCDYIICKSNIKIGLHEVTLGLNLSESMFDLVSNRVGTKKMIEILQTGKIVSGKYACNNWGLIQRCDLSLTYLIYLTVFCVQLIILLNHFFGVVKAYLIKCSSVH